MGVLPMAVFGLEVPAGGMPVAASGEIPAAVSFHKNMMNSSQDSNTYVYRSSV